MLLRLSISMVMISLFAVNNNIYNNMSTLLLYSISCIGLCFILKYGSILAYFRNFLTKYKYFKELFSCSLCLGFWSGLVIGYFSPYNPLIFCTYGAAVCWYSDYILDIIIKNSKPADKPVDVFQSQRRS